MRIMLPCLFLFQESEGRHRAFGTKGGAKDRVELLRKGRVRGRISEF